jgi:hypothetical protein
VACVFRMSRPISNYMQRKRRNEVPEKDAAAMEKPDAVVKFVILIVSRLPGFGQICRAINGPTRVVSPHSIVSSIS